MALSAIQAVAHAKVNLHLGVGPLRSDGFHELVTVFQSLSLSDTLTLNTNTDSQPVEVENFVAGLSVSGNPNVPTDSSNLVWRAAEELYAWHRVSGGEALPQVEFVLNKGIPMAGGMAGGSADAAAALVAVNALFAHPAPREVLYQIAGDLGSDIPFTLAGGTCLGVGRGEQLTKMMTRGTYHWALAFSKEGLSTPAVFKKLDTMERESSMDVSALGEALLSGDPHRVAQHLHNDLQVAALSLQPGLRRTLEIGMNAGALAGIVSGSGPTCAFLCEDAQGALDVAAELQLIGKAVTATGPARGAHISEERKPV